LQTCPQFHLTKKVYYGSEDCLYANIYVPSVSAGNHTLILPNSNFMHGPLASLFPLHHPGGFHAKLAGHVLDLWRVGPCADKPPPTDAGSDSPLAALACHSGFDEGDGYEFGWYRGKHLAASQRVVGWLTAPENATSSPWLASTHTLPFAPG
jgi:hypothetical protein